MGQGQGIGSKKAFENGKPSPLSSASVLGEGFETASKKKRLRSDRRRFFIQNVP
jgi:hypothetical protein